MNAAIRAVVRTALNKGLKVKGIQKGYNGLLNDEIIDMDKRSVADIIQRGGTVLYTARCMEFMTEEGQKRGAEVCRKHGIDGRGVRDRGRLAGELRGEHERGYRTDTEIEKQDYFHGGGIYVHRTADSTACIPRQLGQEPFILRRDLSPEPRADFHIHRRGAETGHEQRTDYRMGPVQCSH